MTIKAGLVHFRDVSLIELGRLYDSWTIIVDSRYLDFAYFE